jgi:hypothetical protein
MENIGLALTNLFLGLACVLYAKYSWKVHTPIPLLRNNVTWLYVSVSVMCMLCFFMFGFYNLPDGEIHLFIEQSILLSSSFVVYFILAIVFTLKMPSKPRKARALLLIPTLLYALFTFQWSTFTYTNIIMMPCLAALCYFMTKMYLGNKNRQLFLGILSVGLIATFTLFQNYLVKIENPFFFMLYLPAVLLTSFTLYRGLALFLNLSNKSGLIHSVANNHLNYLTSTSIIQELSPKTTEEAQEIFKHNKKISKILSCQSSGYSIGGQHLIENGVIINTQKLNKVEFFDSVNGLIKVEPSMSWHELLSYLTRAQKDNPNAWMPKQIPTEFLDYSIGGAVSANTHGNNLFTLPLIKDIASIDLVTLTGEILRVHRKANQELFKLAIGGYGLFGLITGVEFNLSKKRILQRKVELLSIKELPNEITKHTQAGCTHFEFILNTNELEQDFLQTGILSSYLPIEADPKTIQFEPYHQSILEIQTFKENLYMLENNKSHKIKLQHETLKSKNELFYWSNNIVPYFPLESKLKLVNLLFPEYKDYHLIKHEYYIPVTQINTFLNKLSSHKICREFNLIQARITITKKDEESFLFWSSQDYLALELSFNTPNSMQSLSHIKDYLLELTELSIHCQGSFSLGFMQCYEKNHLLHCYPQMPDFLNLKLKHDPSEIFQSNWYQSIKKMIYGTKAETPYLSISPKQIQKRGS